MRSNLDHTAIDRTTVVIVNPSAGGATALAKWRRISSAVSNRLGQTKVVVLGPESDILDIVLRAREIGYSRFVAAGGDGTVNAVVNGLMSGVPTGPKPQFGAIALGSSNDYHKPFRAEQQVEGISCKIDFDQVHGRDVGLLSFVDQGGRGARRYWIVNASLGITAEANALFNRPDVTLRVLKRRSTDAAILYAAIRTIFRFQNQTRLLRQSPGAWSELDITNLSIVKSPYFSGGFCYDSEFQPDSGCFQVHLCEGMSLPGTLYTLGQLSRTHFDGLPHTRSWETNWIAVADQTPFPVEFDGEVIDTTEAEFSIAETRLEVCS